MTRHTEISLNILPAVLGFFMIFSVMKLEKYIFPIVSDFQYTRLYRNIFTVEVEGNYNLLRLCEFVGGNFYLIGLDGQRFNLKERKIKDNSSTFVPPHRKDAGSWEVEYPLEGKYSTVEFNGVYKCHPFWVTEVNLVQTTAPATIADENGKFAESVTDIDLLSFSRRIPL